MPVFSTRLISLNMILSASVHAAEMAGFPSFLMVGWCSCAHIFVHIFKCLTHILHQLDTCPVFSWPLWIVLTGIWVWWHLWLTELSKKKYLFLSTVGGECWFVGGMLSFVRLWVWAQQPFPKEHKPYYIVILDIILAQEGQISKWNL